MIFWLAKVKIKRIVRSFQRLVLHFSFSRYVRNTSTPSRLSIGWGMETRSQAKLRDTTFPPRAATVGVTQPVTDTFVEPPSSAAGHTGDGKVSSRSSSLEAGPRRTCRPIPRSESAGGARGPAQGDARDENRKVADAVDRERVLHPPQTKVRTLHLSHLT